MVFPKVASVEDMKRVAEAYVKNTNPEVSRCMILQCIQRRFIRMTKIN